MPKIIIVGHKNPDTDTIVSAIAAEEYFKNVLKMDAKACRAGELNNETKFILKAFSTETPSLFKNLKKDERVVLVDHNEAGQRPDGAGDAFINGIIDHHKVSLETESPIFLRVLPVGSTASIIAKMYLESGKKIQPKIAKLLIAGIMSDTLGLNSPTTAEDDRKMAKELNKIAKLDLKVFINDMFSAKSSLKGISIDALISQDYKPFKMGKHKVGIGVWETTDPKSVNLKKDEIMKALRKKKAGEKLDLIFFFIVDIVKQESLLFLVGEEEAEAAKKAFKGNAGSSEMLLKGIVSRKKQMVPMLMAQLNK